MKKLSHLTLLMILLVSFLSAFNLQPSFAGEEIVNGGFETGDATGWTLTDGDIQGSVVYSGSYAARIYPFGSRGLNQSVNVAVADLVNLTFWYQRASPLDTPFFIATYTDDTRTIDYFAGGSEDEWYDVLYESDSFEAGKTIKEIAFYAGIYDFLYIDDVSMLTSTSVSSVLISVTSNPAGIGALFTLDGFTRATPLSENVTTGWHTLVCTTTAITKNSTSRYIFDYWSVNGSGEHPNPLVVSVSNTTSFSMHFNLITISPPIPDVYAKNALNVTWYMRSDTHTVKEILGYRLGTVNTKTPLTDLRTSASTANISYGVRVWALDMLGNPIELTDGSPVAIVSRTSDGSGLLSATWLCPAFSTMVYAVEVKVYQRFDTESWSLRRIFITSGELFIKFPSATWTFYYYAIRVSGSTNSSFLYGNYTFNSRLNVQYFRASPWEVAMARLYARNLFGFIFTAWTYWLGDLFYTILLLGMIVTAYNRYGSIKPILALLWIFGGAGSILSSLIPQIALHIAWFMLAIAIAITLFKFIRR